MKSRIITIVIEVDDYKANWHWIYAAHLQPKPIHGIKVIGIADGNAIEELTERELTEDTPNETI